MNDLLDVLEKRTSFVNHFAETGGTLQLSVGWFASRRAGGVSIDHQLLGRLAALHIDTLLDVYATDEHSDNPD